MSESPVKINFEDCMGWVQLIQVQKVENGRLYFGGYSIRYDYHGNEVSRTPVTWNCSLGFHDS